MIYRTNTLSRASQIILTPQKHNGLITYFEEGAEETKGQKSLTKSSKSAESKITPTAFCIFNKTYYTRQALQSEECLDSNFSYSTNNLCELRKFCAFDAFISLSIKENHKY